MNVTVVGSAQELAEAVAGGADGDRGQGHDQRVADDHLAGGYGAARRDARVRRERPGGAVDRIDIGGRLATSGDRVVTLEVLGTLRELSVAGGIHAAGRDSDAAHLGPGAPDISRLHVTAAHGTPVVTV